MTEAPPKVVGAELMKVTLTYIDGTVEEFEQHGQPTLVPGAILFNQGDRGELAIPLTSLKCWRTRRSGLSIARHLA